MFKIRPHPSTSPRAVACASAPGAKVVSFGGAGVDYLASVGEYPRPDEKLRTEKLEVQGGGNSANQATAAARLGLKPVLVTKIGGDGLGQGIIDELQRDGVSTEFVLRAEGHPSPFTYIIVDKKGGTRTCIHTPGAPMLEAEVTPELIDKALKDARLVWFDGRLTEAALIMARAARGRGIPVLVEAERLRPNLDALLAEADYVVTSENFPRDWTGETAPGDAICGVLERLPKVSLLITTMGKKGSVLVERVASSSSSGSAAEPLDATITDLLARAQQQKEASTTVACTTASGVQVKLGGAVDGGKRLVGRTSNGNEAREKAAEVAKAAAARAASLNSDKGNASKYEMAAGPSTAERPAPLHVHVYAASAAGIPGEAVADTTGAGDSVIGSVVYGLVNGLPRAKMLQLASVVAAAKCTALGARPGLPWRKDLLQDLLH